MRNKLFAPLLLFAVYAQGCATSARISDNHPIRIVPVHYATEEERAIIYGALASLPQKVQDTITSIYVQPTEHFKKRLVLGHCYPNSAFCLRKGMVHAAVVWHETGHAFLFKNPALQREWRVVAGGMYREYDSDIAFPHNGILTRYGSKDYQEDFAEYVEETYQFLTSKFSHLVFLKNQKDERYFKKVSLLHTYGVISDAQFARIKKAIFPKK